MRAETDGSQCVLEARGKTHGRARNSLLDSASHKLRNIIETYVPPETVGRGFQLHFSFRIYEDLAPLREVVPMAFLFADVEVLRLTAYCVSNDKRLWIQPYRADPAAPQCKAAGEDDE